MRFLILLCLWLPTQVFSDTSLWRVSKNGAELFIGGTIHVLSHRDYPLPEEFSQAYQKSQILVLETDISRLNNQEMKTKLLQKLMYGKKETLKNHLKPATYQALEQYLKTVNISIDSLQQFKPTLIMLTLTMAELQRLNLAKTGVDAFFTQKAVADGKPLGQLETAEKQLQVLATMGEGRDDEMILSTLDDLKHLPEMMQDLKTAWRNGDLTKLESLGVTPLQKDYPALYQSLLVERNMSWIPQIEGFLNTPETELILIGALHLVGKDGLLTQLRQRGYKIEAF